MATRTVARLLMKLLIMRLLRILASVVRCPGGVCKMIACLDNIAPHLRVGPSVFLPHGMRVKWSWKC